MSKKGSTKKHNLTYQETIRQKIQIIRGQRVILDSDLAQIYGVSTRALNQAVKRNFHRFPSDFAFQLTLKEADSMRSQFVTASKRNIRYRPYVFTEHGALMAATVLNSEQAVAMSVYVIRAFVHLRQVFLDNQILQEHLEEIDQILLDHDIALEDVYKKISQLFLMSRKKTIDYQSGNGGN